MADLPAVLRALLSADNAARGSAEATLRALAKDPQIAPLLLTHARDDPAPEVRQLAAVILKRRVLTHWSKLPGEIQEHVKGVLLDGVVREPVGAVRRAIADVVSKIAKAAVPAGLWPRLPEFLAQCAQSPEEAHRDVAFVLFAALTETILTVMTSHFAALGSLFRAGLRDASPSVRVSALKAALALVANASGDASDPRETKVVVELVPDVLAVARAAIADGNERDAGLAFEILDEIVESQPRALRGASVRDVVRFCAETASAPDLDAVTRRRALDVLAFLARHKPKALLRAKLVGPLLRALCPLCGEPRDEDLAGDALDDVGEAREREMHVQTVAARLVDLLALNVPAKHVLPEVFAFASGAIRDADPRRRHAAVACLGIVAEGCAEGAGERAGEVVPLLVDALRDGQAAEVRGAAAFALGQFAEHVYGVEPFHALVLPTLFAALPPEPDRSAQERMMYAADAWLETLDEGDVAPYVEPLLRIAYLALDGAPTTRPEVREMLLSAVASAAASAGHAMHPHLGELLPRLERCLTSSLDAELRVRARALEALGMLVSARGGAAAMAPHVAAVMRYAESGFELEYSELREYGHGAFCEVAEATGEGFAGYLPSCVAKARASLALDDGVMYDSDEEARASGAGGGGFSFDDDSDDADSGSDDADSASAARRGGSNYSVFSGVVEEKAAACKALSSYAHFCPAAFAPHLNDGGALVRTLAEMADYMHETVRAQAHGALCRFAQCALAAAPRTPGAGRAEARPVVDAALEAARRAMRRDEDLDVVSAAMESAAEILKTLRRDAEEGGGAERAAAAERARLLLAEETARLDAAGHLEDLAASCLAIVRGVAACQEGDDGGGAGGEGGGRGAGTAHSDGEEEEEEEEEEDDEDPELGQIVLEGAAELLPALVALAARTDARRASFAPHVEALVARTHASRPDGQRSVAYAALVDTARAFAASGADEGGARVVREMARRIMPGVARELVAFGEGGGSGPGSARVGLRRNVAYVAGVLCEGAGAAETWGGGGDGGSADWFAATRLGLARLARADAEPDAGVRDNAASALLRVVAADHFAALRAEKEGTLRTASTTLPPSATLAAALAATPLCEDFEEAEAAYGALAAALEGGAPVVTGAFAARIVSVFGEVAETEARKRALAGGVEEEGSRGGETRKTVPAATLARMAAAAAAAARVDAEVRGALAEMPRDRAAALDEASRARG